MKAVLGTKRYEDTFFDELSKLSLLKRAKMKFMWWKSSVYDKLEKSLYNYQFGRLEDIKRENINLI